MSGEENAMDQRLPLAATGQIDQCTDSGLPGQRRSAYRGRVKTLTGSVFYYLKRERAIHESSETHDGRHAKLSRWSAASRRRIFSRHRAASLLAGSKQEGVPFFKRVLSSWNRRSV
jgi:hypothetical protein